MGELSDSSDRDKSIEFMKCFKCYALFNDRTKLYEHYSVQHFHSNIIKAFKPQEVCPIPSCNVNIIGESMWVAHVGAKHNIVESCMPKEHRIPATTNIQSTANNKNGKRNSASHRNASKPPTNSSKVQLVAQNKKSVKAQATVKSIKEKEPSKKQPNSDLDNSSTRVQSS